MACPESIRRLAERFERNKEAYTSQSYNETQLREEFINPLFEALGWDVRNREGRAEAYKDVIHEDAIKIGASTKAPDYSFRIGGQRKFFVETKKPSVNIKADLHPAYQIRRYSWSAKLPLAILTAEIADATFGMTPKQYLAYKGLIRENLRDHMTDLELIFTMLGEAATTEISRKKDARGFGQKQGRGAAGRHHSRRRQAKAGI